jgi:hypothetical protein
LLDSGVAMVLGYVIDTDRRLVVISGDYGDPSAWLRLATELMRDPHLQPGFSFLRDLRGATDAPQAALVVAMFDVVRRFWPAISPRKAAIVTGTDDSAAIVAQALADIHGLPIELFTSFDMALEWLDATGEPGNGRGSTIPGG